MTDVFERLTRFVQQVFKTTVEIFLEALKLSPNAQGYVLGSVTELLLKKQLEELGFEKKDTREMGRTETSSTSRRLLLSKARYAILVCFGVERRKIQFRKMA